MKVPASMRSGNDIVCSTAVQPIDPLDLQPARAVADDLGAHLVQEFREITHLGLAGGALDNGEPLRARGGHHDVVGAKHSRAEFTAEEDFLADEIRLGDVNIAAFAVRGRAEFREPLEVNVNRAIADGAAAGLRNRGVAVARDDWAEHANRGAHLTDEFIGHFGNDLLCAGRDRAALELHLGTELAHDFEHEADVGEIGHVVQYARFRRQQCRRQDRQCRVFRAADFHASRETGATFYYEFVHDVFLQFTVC